MPLSRRGADRGVVSSRQQRPVLAGMSLEALGRDFVELDAAFRRGAPFGAEMLNDVEDRCRLDCAYSDYLDRLQRDEQYRLWARKNRGKLLATSLNLEGIVADCATMRLGEERVYILDRDPEPRYDYPELSRGLVELAPAGWIFKPHWDKTQVAIFLAPKERK